MKSYRALFGFVALLLIVGMACGASAQPTEYPTLPPVPTTAPVQQEQPQNNGNQGQPASGNGEMATFVDANNLLAFDLPNDWTYEHSVV